MAFAVWSRFFKDLEYDETWRWSQDGTE